MGCDIHIFAEVKTEGKWTKVGNIFKGWREGELIDEPYCGRNYDLFAILADVRNGRGFAGVVTGSGFNPICEPKGIPDDVSPEIKEDSDRWNGDGHSHSWLTIQELLNYDWNQLTVKSGVVSEVEYKEYKKSGSPSAWCGSVSGGSVMNVDNDVMDKVISSKKPLYPGKSIYTRVEWGSTYRERVSNFLDETMPALQKLGNPENVRIVFWFDN